MSDGASVRKLGKAASSAASAVDSLSNPNSSYTGTRKDASHGAFYAGVAKGFMAAVRGTKLFLSNADLRALVRESMSRLATAEIAYGILGIGIVLYMKDPADEWMDVFWLLSRWSHLATVASSFFLSREIKATEKMYVDSIAVKHPEFAEAIQMQPRVRPTFRETLHKFGRIARMGLFRAATYGVKLLMPGGRYVALPAIKFVSMRPTLGVTAAGALSALHALPESLLEQTRFDDILMSFSEAIIDANELGNDAVKAYTKRLPNQETRVYFEERYRGYLTGMGFFYSIFAQIPFLGVPLLLIAQAGAAEVTTDIVKRNLAKDERMRLLGEEALQT